MKGRSVTSTRTHYECEECARSYDSVEKADACCVCRSCGAVAPRTVHPLPDSSLRTLGRDFSLLYGRGLCRRCLLLLAASRLRTSASQYHSWAEACSASADDMIAALDPTLGAAS